MNKPPSLGGLRHLALLVPNLEECVEFYTNVLGMAVLRRANDNLIYLTSGNDNLSLGRLVSDQEQQQRSSLDHMGFVVNSKSDLTKWYSYLMNKDVDVLDKPHDHTDSARSFHCKDPAGNVVQLIYHPCFTPWQQLISG